MADDFLTGTRSAACGGTTTVIPFAAQDQGPVAARGGGRLPPARGREGAGRLRLPHDRHRPDRGGAEGGAAGADRRGLHLVQDLHDLRRPEAGRPPDPAAARGRAATRRAGHGPCGERRLHRVAERGARSRRPHRAEVPRRFAADGGGARSHAPRDRAVGAGRRADPHRARVGPRGDRPDPLGPRPRPAHLRRDLPAVPVPDGLEPRRGLRRRQVRLQPAAARQGQPARGVGRLVGRALHHLLVRPRALPLRRSAGQEAGRQGSAVLSTSRTASQGWRRGCRSCFPRACAPGASRSTSSWR